MIGWLVAHGVYVPEPIFQRWLRRRIRKRWERIGWTPYLDVMRFTAHETLEQRMERLRREWEASCERARAQEAEQDL